MSHPVADMMTDQVMDPNPQAEQMADESMIRNLGRQAEAIWPQERKFFERYGLGPGTKVLDVGCGTGEIAERLLRFRTAQGAVIALHKSDRHGLLVRIGCVAQSVTEKVEGQDDEYDRHHRVQQPGI